MSRGPESRHVYLVGAGPGDPELITVRGLRLLRAADVVVHDRLIHVDLLREARPDAEIFNVGKVPGRTTVTQDEINDILIWKASEGRSVVRLKGGDPFVFGRGGEEGMALAKAGIGFDIVPGVTSAISAPAFAGIPLLLRGVAANFAVVTGHATHEEEEPDWHALARLDTLVVLMGLRRRERIARRLIEAGRDPDSPAAVVGSATTTGQQTASGTLRDIQDWGAGLRTPAVIVIGDVVGYRPVLDWFHTHATHTDWMEVAS